MLSTFTAEFEMPVWRVLPFCDAPWLAVELRDQGLLQAKFAVVELTTGKVVLSPSPGPDLWWTGLQGAAHGQLYLHVFNKQPQVGVSGLSAVAADNGKQSWHMPGLALREINAEYIKAQPATNPDAAAIYLAPNSGRIIAEPTSDTGNGFESRNQPEFPVLYSPENPHFSTLQEFLHLKIEHQVQGPIEYLETTKHIVFSVHIQEEEALINYLLIFENSGHLRCRKKLNQQLKGFATDTFFLLSDKIVCVQNNTKLLIIDLQN